MSHQYRPDDVWIAILGQFNFYVNANAEQLRSNFVAHEGKKKLTVRASGTRYTVDFGALAHQMTELIYENVVDKSLKDWVLPDFSTTSSNDTVVCAVLMMATLKAIGLRYTFSHSGGQKEDWVKLLTRLDKLATSFGKEPEAWAVLLRPILRRFVLAFDEEPDIQFWGRICHFDRGSGSAYLWGWITAFCVWDSEGKWQGPKISDTLNTSPDPSRGVDRDHYRLNIDGVQYRGMSDSAIPAGFCEVDVDLNDNGKHFDCMMVSGHVATRIQGPQRDTLSPSPGWFMFIKHKETESAPSPLSIKKGEPETMPAEATTGTKKEELPKERCLQRWKTRIRSRLQTFSIFRTPSTPK